MSLAQVTTLRINAMPFAARCVSQGYSLAEVRGAIAASFVVLGGYSRAESHALARIAI